MRMPWRLVAPILAPMALLAQRPDTSTIPRDLATGLMMMSNFLSEEPAIIVGRLPDADVARFVPRGARVLGGAMFARGPMAQVVTVMVMSEASDSAVILTAAQLEGAGLKTPPMFDTMSGAGGFVSSSIGSGGESSAAYCGANQFAYVSASERRRGGSLVLLSTSTSLRNTLCDTTMRTRFRGGRSEIELPTLRPPPGARIRGTSGGGGSHSRESTGELRSPLTAIQLLDHFAVQMKEQSWTLGNRFGDDDLSVQAARKTNSDGEQLYLLIIDNRFTPGTHSMSLRVWRESRDRN
jgi:hypothetical protein